MSARVMPARPLIEGLEPKLLFSADLAGALGLDTQDIAQVTPTTPAPLESTSLSTDNQFETERGPRALVVVDAGVDDLSTLLRDLGAQVDDPSQIVVIQRDEDGLSRITQALEGQEGLSAIHLISHGSDGEIRLGHSVLNANTLLQRAAEVAAWGQALDEGADWLIYGCEVAAGETGRALVSNLALLTGADVHASDDLTGRGGDWALEVHQGQLDARILLDASTSWAGQLAQAEPSSKGMGVWSDASTGSLKYGQWDGVTLQTIGSTQVATNWNVMTSAVSPSGQTAIAMGVDSNGAVSVQRWTGTQWEAMAGNPLVNGISADRQGFAVAYEQASGQALVVWNNGSGLSYVTHDGANWSSVRVVSIYSGSEPMRMQLVAQPKGDGMLLTVSDGNVEDRALAWNGSNWVSEQVLDTSGGPSYRQLAVNAAYESVSGLGMVFYGRSDVNGVFYRTFDGLSWSAQQTVPLTLNEGVLSIVTGSAANSDAVGLGITSLTESFWGSTYQQHFLRWDGDAWSAVLSGPRTGTVGAGTVAVAFESRSGDMLAAYANTSNTPLLSTLAQGSNTWSAALTGPELGATPGWFRLSSDPLSNHIMLSAQGSNGTLVYADWDGSQLSSVTQATSNNGSTLSPGFSWFWRADPQTSTGTSLLVGSSGGGPGWPGLNQIAESELLALDRQGLLLESPDTQGTFSHHWDLAAFGASTLDDVVWVSQSVMLSSGLTLQRGDLLFTVANGSTLTSQNSISVNNNDIVMFRPVSSTDYSRGQFQKIIGALGANGGLLGSGSTPDIRGLALVEQDTLVGDTLLKAGEILFTAGSGSTARDIHVFTPDSVGLLGALLTGTTRTLLIGNDIGLNADITALEIVSQSASLGGAALQQGDLLLTLGQSDTFGDNNGSVEARDIALLRLATTSYTGGASGNVTLLLDGSDLGLPGTPMDSLAIRSDPTPEITSLGGGQEGRVSVSENSGLTVTTVVANGVPGGSGVRYSIMGGADASRFTLDAGTGQLSFLSSKDREAPSDGDQNNVYEVQVMATDGGRSDSQLILVTVTDVNEAPELTAGTTVSADVVEFQSLVGTLQATDPDSPSLSWRIVGGADAALFTVSGNELRFAQTPDTTMPPYLGHGPVYTVALQASDGALDSPTQTWSVELKPVNRPPINTLPSSATTDEDTELVLQGLNLSDVDAGNAPIELVFSVLHGRLSLDTTVPGGVTSWVIAADGRTLTLNASVAAIQQSLLANALRYRPDVHFNGVDTLTMRSDDLGASGEAALNGITRDTDTLTLNVTPVNDAPTLSAPSELSLPEGGSVALSPTAWSASDVEDSAASLRYQLTQPPSHGRIELSTDPGTALTEFTQAQIDANIVRYVHDGSESTTDIVNLQVIDAQGRSSAPQTLTLRISAVNDAPELSSSDSELAVLEGEGAVVSSELWRARDAEDTVQNLRYELSQAPVHGRLVWTGAPTQAITRFTQAQLDAGEIRYFHDGGENTRDTLTLVLLDSNDARSTPLTLTLGISPVNDAPELSALSSLNVAEGAPVTLPASAWTLTDAEDPPLSLRYRVIQPSEHGRLEHTDAPGSALSAFTQADLAQGKIRYLHDGSETTQDRLVIQALDTQDARSAERVLNFVVSPVDDIPQVVRATLQVQQGQSATPELSVLDPDTAATDITLTVLSAQSGEFVDVNTQQVIQSFTLAQLQAGQVMFRHDGSTNVPNVILSVSAGPHVLNDIALSVGFTLTPLAPATPDGPLSLGTATEDSSNEPGEEPTATSTDITDDATSPEATTSATVQAPELEAVISAPIEGALDLQNMRLASALGWSMPGAGIRTFVDNAVNLTRPDDAPATEMTDLTPRWNGSLASSEVLDEINQRLGQLREDLMQPESRRQTLMASSIALTTGLSVGYVIWLVRGGALLGSMLSSMPLWNMVDPLPVLNRAQRPGQGPQSAEDDPSVEQLFDHPASVPEPPVDSATVDTPAATPNQGDEPRGAS